MSDAWLQPEVNQKILLLAMRHELAREYSKLLVLIFVCTDLGSVNIVSLSLFKVCIIGVRLALPVQFEQMQYCHTPISSCDQSNPDTFNVTFLYSSDLLTDMQELGVHCGINTQSITHAHGVWVAQ